MVDVAELTSEFKQFGLNDASAHRAAFTALAYRQGWSTARIGRYLGVSRARVGQRIERLYRYTETRADMPLLTQVLRRPAESESIGAMELPVGFPADNWEDAAFASGMLRLVA